MWFSTLYMASKEDILQVHAVAMEISATEADEHKTTISKEEIDGHKTLISAEEMDGIKTLTSEEEMDDINNLTSVEKSQIYKTLNSIEVHKSTSADDSDGCRTSSSVVDALKYKTFTSWEATIIMLLFSANFFLFMCSLGYMGMGSSLLVLDQHFGAWEKYAGHKIVNLGYILIVLGLLLCISTSIGYGIFPNRNQPSWIKFYMSVMLILLLLLLLGVIVYLVPTKEVEEVPGLWDKVKSKIPLKGRNKWNELKEDQK